MRVFRLSLKQDNIFRKEIIEKNVVTYFPLEVRSIDLSVTEEEMKKTSTAFTEKMRKRERQGNQYRTNKANSQRQEQQNKKVLVMMI